MRAVRGSRRRWLVVALALGVLPALYAGGEAEVSADGPPPADSGGAPPPDASDDNEIARQIDYGTVRLVRPNGSMLRVFSNGDIEVPDALGIQSLASPAELYNHAFVFSHNIAAYRYLFESYEERGYDGEVEYQSLAGLGIRMSIAGTSGLIDIAPFLSIGPPLVGSQLVAAGMRIVDPTASQDHPTGYIGPFAIGDYDPTQREEANGEVFQLGYLHRFDVAMPIHIGGFGGRHPALSWIKVLPRVTFDFADPSFVSFQVGAELYLVLGQETKGNLLGGDE